MPALVDYQFRVLFAVITAMMVLAAGQSANASRRQGAGTVNLGILVMQTPQGLIVSQVTNSAPYANLRVGDVITAVNGRRVPTPAALINRVSLSGYSAPVTVFRDGRRQVLGTNSGISPSAGAATLAKPSGGSGHGWINPSQMVVTSEGVMHRAAAARRGLSGTVFSGTPESSGGVTFPAVRSISVAASTGSPSGASPTMAVPNPGSGGWMNPSQMVMTSQGVMHRDAAARLGLSGTPITGSPESSGGVTFPATVFIRR